FSAARQHDGRAQVGRRGPDESHALARGQREPNLLDAQAAERFAVRHGWARCRHDLRANRRDRRRVRGSAGWARDADPKHELQHGCLWTVLRAPNTLDRGTIAQPMHSSDPPARPLLGPVGKGTTGARKDSTMKRTIV